MKKRLLLTLLMLVMSCVLLITPVYAEESYTFDSETGSMTVYTQDGVTAWVGTVSSDEIRSVTFECPVTIENGDFANCSSLTTVVFEEETTVKGSGFSGCTSLESVTFESIGTVTEGGFVNCPNIKTLTFNNAINLSQSAFYVSKDTPNTVLEELTFPVDLKLAYADLFSNYQGLKTITFKGYADIGGSNFSNCTSLETVVFEDESSLNQGAFSGCTALKTLTFAKLTYIDYGVFSYSRENPNTALESLSFPADSSIAKGGAFSYFKALKNVTFEGYIELGGVCFNDCTALESVVFEDEAIVTDGTFRNCPNIKNLTFKKKVYLGSAAFNCDSENPNTALESLTFPAESELQKASLFYNYKALKNVTFKGNITVGSSNFGNCTALESVVFEDEATVTDGAFINCNSLKSLTFAKAVELSGSAFNCSNNTALESLTFPAGSQFARNGLFYNFTGLKNVTFKGYVELGGSNFGNCTALESVVFEDEATVIDGAFVGCNALKNLTFAKAVKLDSAAFSCLGNTSLESLEFPEDSELADTALFADYKALKKVTFNGEISVGGSNFNNCTALETVIFNNNATVKNKAFVGCTAIEKVVFMGRVTISDFAFASAYNYDIGIAEESNVKAIMFGSQDPSIYERSLDIFNTSKTEIFVPCNRLEEYRTELQYDVDCNAKYSDNLSVNHFAEKHIEEKAPTCTEAGNIEYYICDDCNKYFKDADKKVEITDKNDITLAATGHSPETVKAEAATCTKNGYTGDIKCKTCGETLQNGKVISATGHKDSDKDDICDVCGKSLSNNEYYYVIDGNNSEWSSDIEAPLTFKFSVGLENHKAVRVDGKLLSEKYYTVGSDSTVTLNVEYLKTLSDGKHTFTVVYPDGECSADFVINGGYVSTGDTENYLLIAVFVFAALVALYAYNYKKKEPIAIK